MRMVGVAVPCGTARVQPRCFSTQRRQTSRRVVEQYTNTAPSLRFGRITRIPKKMGHIAVRVEAMQGGACFEETKKSTLLCSSLTAPSVHGMIEEAKEAHMAGADVVELRIDFLQEFRPEQDLEVLLREIELPCIVTYRPSWEGGQYTGEDAPRLAALKLAMELGAAYVDVEFLIAPVFMAAIQSADGKTYSTKVIVSSHDYESTACSEDLKKLIQAIRMVGADVVKFATTGTDISDGSRVLQVVREASRDGPVIGLCMGERGQSTRILAPKYGGYLTFGALSPERQSAPGQPTIHQLKNLYRLDTQSERTKVLGIVGNPVGHSKSPAIHNGALIQSGLDYVYIPLLVDDFGRFFESLPDDDWVGLSVTIPHKTAALEAAETADEVAQRIAAANTLVRQDDGGFKAYNTDWLAAISSIEQAMIEHGMQVDDCSPLKGKTVVVIGAGGAGRALAFGASTKGAHVVIANRTADKAIELAGQLNPKGTGVSLNDLKNGSVAGDVLVNTTSVGMQPHDDESPVPKEVTSTFSVVFDAVYTPLHTKLLRDAAESGAVVVTGEKMFVGQAAEQYRLFTGHEPDMHLMTDIVLGRK